MFDNNSLTEIDVIQPAKRNSPKFPAVEGIEFVKMEKKNTDTYKSVVFTFRDQKGAVLKDTVFEPRKTASQTDEKFKKQMDLVHSHLGHISRAYLSEEIHKSIKGTDWDSYVGAMARALQVNQQTGQPAVAAGVKADAKIIFRETKGKYYSSFPAIPPFLSTPNHPKDFKVDPKYDLFEIPEIQPDREDNSGFNGAAPTAGLEPNSSTPSTKEVIGW